MANVEKFQESFTYDVELGEEHFTVTLGSNLNNGYAELSVYDAEGNPVNEKTNAYLRAVAAMDNYFENQKSNERSVKMKMIKVNWAKALEATEVVLRTIRTILIGR
jgi:hypothetical protein